jgi:hypothetical protein
VARGLRASAIPDGGAIDEMSGALASLTAFCEPATDADRRCVEERQLQHPMSAMVAVGKRCKYGFPQAITLDPRAREKYGLGGHPIDAALFRLTCPHLVKEIDAWEAEGAVRAFNARVAEYDAWMSASDEANAKHRIIRRALIGSEVECAKIEANPVLSIILNSGLAGNNKKGDIKCLHAQLADGLSRGGNAVADGVLDGLRERGVAPEGGPSCWQQCDSAHTHTPESWEYMPRKNRQKLRATTERRRKLMATRAARAAEPVVAARGAAKAKGPR